MQTCLAVSVDTIYDIKYISFKFPHHTSVRCILAQDQQCEHHDFSKSCCLYIYMLLREILLYYIFHLLQINDEWRYFTYIKYVGL